VKVLKGTEELGGVESCPCNVKTTLSLQVIEQLPAIDYARKTSIRMMAETNYTTHALRGIAK